MAPGCRLTAESSGGGGSSAYRDGGDEHYAAANAGAPAWTTRPEAQLRSHGSRALCLRARAAAAAPSGVSAWWGRTFALGGRISPELLLWRAAAARWCAFCGY